MLNGNNNLRSISGITDIQKQQIKKFLRDIVDAWCIKNKSDPFCFRDLMSDNTCYWENTPLRALYEKHIKAGKNNDEAVKEAGKEVGMLLKAVLVEDRKKTFGQEKVSEGDVTRSRYHLFSQEG